MLPVQYVCVCRARGVCVALRGNITRLDTRVDLLRARNLRQIDACAYAMLWQLFGLLRLMMAHRYLSALANSCQVQVIDLSAVQFFYLCSQVLAIDSLNRSELDGQLRERKRGRVGNSHVILFVCFTCC